jgi:hypothetical protein
MLNFFNSVVSWVKSLFNDISISFSNVNLGLVFESASISTVLTFILTTVVNLGQASFIVVLQFAAISALTMFPVFFLLLAIMSSVSIFRKFN